MQQALQNDTGHDAGLAALALVRRGALHDAPVHADAPEALADAVAARDEPLERGLHLDITRTAAALGDALERAIRPRGLTGAQYNVLRILREAEPAGLCRNALRDRLPSRMPDVTRLLDRLEGAGLVTRQRDPQDRRLVTTCITPAGRRLADELDAAVRDEHRRRLGFLAPGQVQTLTDLLALVRAGIEPAAPRARR